MVTVVLDRRLHPATTLNIKGESYRLKKMRKEGLLSQPKLSEGNEKEVVFAAKGSDLSIKEAPSSPLAKLELNRPHGEFHAR